MIKYYNGEMFRIPQAFETEVRADERTKVLDEVEAKLLANGFIITHHALDVWHEIAEQLKEQEEYEPYVDWSKVEVDTKVLVSDDNKHWFKRHFAKYEDGKIYAWRDGRTSWSSENAIYWNHAKLYEEEENKTVTYYSGDKVYYQGRLYSAEQIEERKNDQEAKMTEQESIDLLRFAYPKEFTKPITEKVISMAVEALEKQTPKKPTQVDKWGDFFQCPKCNKFVTDNLGCRMKYCSRCGQALKWESEE